MKKTVIIIVCLLLTISGVAQTTQPDTTQAPHPDQQQMEKRRLTLKAEMTARAGGDYHLTQDGQTIESGNSSAYLRAGVGASYPVLLGRAGNLSASLGYSHTHQRFDADEMTTDYGMGEASHHNFGVGLSGMGRLRLWGKTLMLTGVANAEWSQYGFERWMAMGMATYMLRETRDTQFGVGFIYLVNTFLDIPVFPTFMYRHTFNRQWSVNIMIPGANVCYAPTPNDVFTLGGVISADHYFIRPKSTGLPNRVRFNRGLVNVGPTYEHRFSQGFVLKAEVGASIPFSNHISESGSSTNLADVSEKVMPYVTVGISKSF